MRTRLSLALALACLAAATAIHSGEAPIHGQVDEPPAAQAEEPWPMESTGDISVLVVRERYRIYTQHCATELPIMKAAFEDVMKSLSMRIRTIGTRLLDSERFRDMKQQQVSSTLRGALSAELRDIRLDLEEQDAAQVCPETLRSYLGTTDALLEDFLQRTLAGVRSTSQTLKSRSAP